MNLRRRLLGIFYGGLKQYQEAIHYYEQALPFYRASSDRTMEALLLTGIGRLYVTLNSPVSAIEPLQKLVEVHQSIRAGLADADQQAYTNRITADYRLLADLLRQQNRAQEAQAILDLL